MSSINLHTKEINIKVVYYGPGLGGKTTSLQYIHRTLKPDLRGQLVSLATGIDRTLYFDFLPIKLPKVKDFNIRMSLYTVPGQVHYNATRKLVLQGCDGVVFVADSQPARKDGNIESLRNLGENLKAQGMAFEQTPVVLQYNKRDLTGSMSIEQMDADLNPLGLPRFASIALTGHSIFDALKAIAKLVLLDLKRKGIYRERPKTKVPEFGGQPVLAPAVEQGLVQELERQQSRRPATLPPPSGRVSMAPLWPLGPTRYGVVDLEEAFARREYADCVQRAAVVLRSMLSDAEAAGAAPPDPAEALWMLGVYGPYYARFNKIGQAPAPSEEDALFCLFFLVDVQLRMQAMGLAPER